MKGTDCSKQPLSCYHTRYSMQHSKTFNYTYLIGCQLPVCHDVNPYIYTNGTVIYQCNYGCIQSSVCPKFNRNEHLLQNKGCKMHLFCTDPIFVVKEIGSINKNSCKKGGNLWFFLSLSKLA